MGKKRLLISTITMFALFFITAIMPEGFSAGKKSGEEWDGNAKAAEEVSTRKEEVGQEKNNDNTAKDSAGQENTEDMEQDFSSLKATLRSFLGQREELKILSLDLPEEEWAEDLLQQEQISDVPLPIPSEGTESEETENEGIESKEAESEETESKGIESKEAENKETESEETESKEVESNETENEEIESKETENKETENKETESDEKENNESPEAVFQYDYAVAKVTEYVNIREGAGTEHAVVGKLYRNSYAEIIERGEEWTKVSSGSVTGYIHNDYLSFDEEAVRALQKENALLAEVNAGTVNLRTGPGTDSEIIKEVKKGNTFLLEPAECLPEWTAVLYEGTVAYLSSQFVIEKITFQTAVSKEEEEKAAVEAAAKAALEKSLMEAKKYTPAKTNRAAVNLNDEDLFLLAIVVEMEASGESYQGKLAVANVVINRLLSGKWGKTISSVVYAPNQFSGANSGRIEQFSTKVSEDSKKAAVAAAAGENNIGDYLYFRMKSTANYSNYSKYYILGSHCFYMP